MPGARGTCRERTHSWSTARLKHRLTPTAVGGRTRPVPPRRAPPMSGKQNLGDHVRGVGIGPVFLALLAQDLAEMVFNLTVGGGCVLRETEPSHLRAID